MFSGVFVGVWDVFWCVLFLLYPVGDLLVFVCFLRSYVLGSMFRVFCFCGFLGFWVFFFLDFLVSGLFCVINVCASCRVFSQEFDYIGFFFFFSVIWRVCVVACVPRFMRLVRLCGTR